MTSSTNAGQHGRTDAIGYAMQRDNLELVKILLQHGANIDASFEYRYDSSEGIAIAEGSVSARRHVVRKPVRGTALIAGSFHDNVSIVRWLLSLGADPNAVASNGMTAIGHAIENHSSLMIGLLLDEGADINQIYSLQKTADVTISATSIKGVEYKNIDKLETDGTALHAAVLLGDLAIAELLISRGASLDVPNCNGESALDMALKTGNSAMISLLENQGRVN